VSTTRTIRIAYISTDAERAIVELIGSRFRCFGGGRTSGAEFNPLVEWTKDEALQFAAGVDVAEVVRFVLEQAGVKRG